jgi:hypothetical protein
MKFINISFLQTQSTKTNDTIVSFLASKNNVLIA